MTHNESTDTKRRQAIAQHFSRLADVQDVSEQARYLGATIKIYREYHYYTTHRYMIQITIEPAQTGKSVYVVTVDDGNPLGCNSRRTVSTHKI